MNRTEIEDEILRLKKYGINPDQKDKSIAEEYLDAVAERRMIEELEQKLIDMDEIKYGANSGRNITTTDSKGVSEQHQIGYSQGIPDSQRVSTLEQIVAQLQSIKYRLQGERCNEGLSGYNMYITSVQDDVEYLRKAVENTISDMCYIQCGEK